MEQIFLTKAEIEKIEDDLWENNKGKVPDSKILYDIEQVKRAELKIKRNRANCDGPSLLKMYAFMINMIAATIKVDMDAKYSLVYGDCQTGKRGEILGHAIRSLQAGKQVVIVTDNFTIQKQTFVDSLLKGVSAYNRRHNDNMDCFGESRYGLEHIVYSPKKFSVDEWKDKMQDNKLITVCILNVSPLSEIYQGIRESQTQEFSIIFDEADVGTIKDANTDKIVQRREIVQNIMGRGNVCSLFVTATWLSMIKAVHKSVTLYGRNINSINPNNSFITSTHPNFSSVNIDDRMEKDGSLSFEQIDDIITSPNSLRTHKWRCGEVKAVVVNICIKVEVQNNLVKYLADRHKNAYFVVVNDGCVTVHMNIMNENEERIIKKIDGSVSDGINTVRTDWVNCYEKSGKRTGRYLIVVGGKMLGRSASCRSELVKKPKHCYDMLICNNEIYVATKDAPIDNIHQGSSRHQGFYPYTKKHKQPKTRLFASTRVLDVAKTHHNAIMDQIENFKNDEYVDIKISATDIPLELGKMKVCSKSKIKNQKNYVKGGKCYLTPESRDRVVVDSGDVLKDKIILKPDTLAKKVYDILKDNKDCWMSCREITDFHNEWGINSTNPINSIATELLHMFKGGLLNRENNTHGVYVYKIN